ncbi:MAG TPA: hypothetical protein VG759_09405 [Candidatus Angelobacter sp.]|jgi:hypothetical protein|nr:hypothetical protein [Candidatus Angelobacter sp.]
MKTILLDECVPKKFQFSLIPHLCVSVREAGFAGKKNGELLALAEGRFDVFLTVDKSLRYQQNMKDRQIAVLIIRAHGNSLAILKPHAAACLLALESIQLGEVVEVGLAA